MIFYQSFLFPQVKRSAIISNKNGIKKLQNDLGILGNYERSEKSQNFIKL